MTDEDDLAASSARGHRPARKPLEENESAADLRIPATGETRIEPGSSKLIYALRHLGYTLEQAVSDLVDNSVSADAKSIVMRFVTRDEALEAFVIADNGRGMDEQRLTEAMRFGSAETYDDRSLGKYGLGLKLASVSQAKTVEVLTRSNGHSCGKRWTIQGLSRDWLCDTLDSSEVQRVMDQLHPEIAGKLSGTLIVWRDIDRLNLGHQGLKKGVEQLTLRINRHLGLHFHRFLESGRVQMFTEVCALGKKESAQRLPITPINPFSYPMSGDPAYPKSVQITMPNAGSLVIKACIWPPNSKDRAYRLGGKASQRQGFYFYRRDRLIQAGGWNGIVEDETEPHLSLARAAIELPDELDSEFGLNVQKSKVVTPPAFATAIALAKGADGSAWLAGYRRAANQAYRKDDRVRDNYPLVPSGGLPAEIIDLARKELADGRERKLRSVRIQWAPIASPDFFEFDRDGLTIHLNKNYRSAVLGGRRGSSTDAPIVKLLLFLLLEEDFERDRTSKGRKDRLDAINRLLSEAVKHEDRH